MGKMSEQEKSPPPLSLSDRVAEWSHWANFIASLATAVGVAIAVFGLWLGVAQLKATVKQQKIAASAQVAQTSIQLGDIWREHMTLFLEHPKLRPFFFDGAKVADGEPLLGEAEAMADLRLDAMDRVLAAARLGDIDVSGWKPTFERAFKTSPMMCAVLQDVQGDYPDIEGSEVAKSCFTGQSR